MRNRSIAAFAALALFVIPACAPGSDSASDRPEEKPASEVQTDPAELGDVTLTVWDQEVRGGQEEQITKLNKAFEREYPNIEINRVPRSFDDLRNTSKLGLTGNEAPDVLQVNNGKQDMGSFVEAGLLQPLDSYAEAYGWGERFSDSVLRLSKYPDSGDQIGEGKLYGLPQTAELVGIFYNKEKLAELDLEPPKTWREFDAALEKARSAGELPIQFGNLEKTPGIFLFSFAMHRFGDPQTESELALGAPGATWDTDANRKAARQLLDWADANYLTRGFSGVTEDDAWEKFASGTGVFHVSGTWLTADLQEAMGENVGFLLPPPNNDQSSVTGGTGLPFAISAKSQNQDAAAAYIEFITSAEAMKVLAETGNLPVNEAGSQGAKGLQRQVFDAWQQTTGSESLVPYLDYATGSAFETITGGVEQLLSKQLEVPAFLEKLQKDLDSGSGGN
ncbi:carbohydrate ABC transporter substrate-binding protein (CUT1 family) [Tamaricihabitans halophyticus]|uniref:Carbohydrate ABC transporter substrate-binding protein (CUT1 family) n=1 Tax=Tamaricihabitans halophyticus TaxID=1262583 RepID=A0A4R2R0I3_9PSEU|nr:extracellular solute-binding protein [Tamaricihabitans halophyticus]TCP54948.1 carbohydrate ABC transporter substrate-binding protein (CUT1 family) [Tamaricihabitans halophyticus]